jgi:outer membrane protein assembly factor BamB
MVRKWVALVGLLGLAAGARASDWPQFRGPSASGLSDESKLPAEWGADKNIGWKVKVPGVAWSSPIVWGDKVFITTAITDKQTKPKPGDYGFGGGGFGKFKGKFDPSKFKGKFGKFGKGGFGKGGFGKFGGGRPPDVVYRWEVHCLDRASGKVLWKKTAAEGKPTIPIHSTNTYASETPITDGERVYAYFGPKGVYCYDLTGKELWKKELGSYRMMFGFGTGSSPALEGERLFIQCDNEEKSFLVALDRKTGDELWRVRRANKSSWGTPFVWKTKKRTEIVCAGGSKVTAYEPSKGKVLWEVSDVEGQFSATPVASEDMLYFGTGGVFGSRPLVAIKAGASGKHELPEDGESNAAVAWVITGAGPSMASPLLYQGHLYVLSQQGGQVYCYDAKTGKRAYRQRLPRSGGFTSSPWAYDGKVFCLDENGTTYVLQPGPKYKLLGTNKLDEMFWSSPAVAGGALFLRGVDHLYCVRQ